VTVGSGGEGGPGGEGGKEEPVAVRAIRGAVQVDANESAAILEGTSELVTEVMARNQLTPADVILPEDFTRGPNGPAASPWNPLIGDLAGTAGG